MPKRITSRAESKSRERAHDEVRGKEREADLERAVPEHELEVESTDEEPCEHRGRPQDADDVRGGDVPEPEQPKRHERRRETRLDHEERDEERSRSRKETKRLREPSTPGVRCRSPIGVYTASISADVTPLTRRPRRRDRRRERPPHPSEEPQRERQDEDPDREGQCQSSALDEHAAPEYARCSGRRP